LVPLLLTVLALEFPEALAAEELDEEPDGGVLDVLRGRPGRWGGVEGQWIQAFG
jgi:hypothetical protein